MVELGIALLCIILAIPFRARWERTPSIDATKGVFFCYAFTLDSYITMHIISGIGERRYERKRAKQF